MRLDRLLTVSLFAPLARLTGADWRAIPILMYHSISRDEERGVHPYYRLTTSPEVFACQMSLLAKAGYEVVSLEAAVGMLRGCPPSGSGDSTRKVVITFDDGFMDFYTAAFPILSERGYTATVFLPTALVEKGKGPSRERKFLSWSQVRELSERNISFGSHSASHGRLVSMSADALTEELDRSKDIIEQRIGKAVEAFSYPYAFPEHRKSFVRRLREILQALGYGVAVTTSIGTATSTGDALFLPRLPVNDDDDERLLRSKLAGGYNWLHAVQYANKSVREIMRGNGEQTSQRDFWRVRSDQ